MTIGNLAYAPERRDDCASTKAPLLFVDLDGTLIKTDLLLESLLALVTRSFRSLVLLPLWLLRGKAYFKARVAERVRIDPRLLPYNEAFLAFLREQKAHGRALILATASDRRLADKVAAHVGLFDAVLASDGHVNMSGEAKLAAMRQVAAGRAFDYAGNARVDLGIWRHTACAIVVNPHPGVAAAAARVATVSRIFEDEAPDLRVYLRAMRAYQWVKNVLVLVPLITAHAWGDAGAVAQALGGFVAFSLCASAIYLLNDLLDLPADRAHPRKRHRPLASGAIPISHGLAMAPPLLASGLAIALVLPHMFLVTLLAYLALTVGYAVHGKIYVLIDVIVLAALYTLRMIGGAFAIGTPPSFWLLAFSMFLFLSLALVKRCAELMTLSKTSRPAAAGRDYRLEDLGYLTSMGTASGYLAALVLALFINDPSVVERYAHPKALWLLCPMVLYWVSRLWIKTGRGEMSDDPIVFTLKDRGSRIVVAACCVVVVLSMRPGF